MDSNFNVAEIRSISVLTRTYYDYQKEWLSLNNRLGINKDKKPKKGNFSLDKVFEAF